MPKKVYFSEEDVAALMQRYDATTVLTLLVEVDLFFDEHPASKIDWNELVSKTTTGISDPKEYQALWRHLAYRHELPENFEDGAESLNDESDLECELEPFPPLDPETQLEAEACVKVMIASNRLKQSAPSSSLIEAPLMINVPILNDNISEPSQPLKTKNIVFPVTVQRQPLSTVASVETLETKPSLGGDISIKKKRKAWSEEEDMQLRAAVQKWGEGNWALMAKGDNFPIQRSATQLAQRWSILRKKDGTTTSGIISTSSQYTAAEQQATRHSLSLALGDMPFNKLTAPGMTDPGAKGNHCPDPAVKATAVATGALIVNPSDTPSQLKASQVRNNKPVMPEGSSLMKSSITAGTGTDLKVHSNVPSVRTGLTAAHAPSQSPVAVIAPASCTSTENHQKAVVSSLDKGSQDLDQENNKNLPFNKEGEAPLVRTTQSDENPEDKAVSQNPG